MNAPLLYAWDGEGMRPATSQQVRLANKQFVVGECYRLEVHEERSRETHNHFFACVSDAWQNLPEEWGERFATPDHLRKWCLIKAGYRDERTFVASSKAEAIRLASFIRPMDDFAVVNVSDAVVTVYTAKSQSTKAMGRRDFQESKTKVLDIMATMLGTALSDLVAQAKGTAPTQRRAKAIA